MADLNFTQQLILTIVDKAIIGVLIIFAAYKFNRFLEILKSERSELLEVFKNKLNKNDESERVLRLAVADISKKIASGSHIICWLCWYARYSPREVSEDSFITYEKEMHALQTDLVGLRVVLAALDREIHTILSPFIDRLYKMDVEVGLSKTLYLEKREEGLKMLGEIHSKSLSFDKDLLNTVTNLSRFRPKD